MSLSLYQVVEYYFLSHIFGLKDVLYLYIEYKNRLSETQFDQIQGVPHCDLIALMYALYFLKPMLNVEIKGSHWQ